ncbi:MAG: hypothetical protein WA863_16075 [Methyloceanibacter sp.]
MTVAEVIGDEVIVTLPLTSYTVTYYKPARSPQLLAKRIASRDDGKCSHLRHQESAPKAPHWVARG